MRRAFALLFLLWGVGTIMAGGANLAVGGIPPEEFVVALIAGVILLAIAWWLDRGRKKPQG